jgi:site-specific DNA-cytosine methylase
MQGSVSIPSEPVDVRLYKYIWGNNVKRQELRGRQCVVLARLPLNSAVIEFENGQIDPRRLVMINGEPYLLDLRFRMLSNLELARAMGFSDEESTYEFVGNISEVTRQIGNAVPVNMAKALVLAIFRGEK